MKLAVRGWWTSGMPHAEGPCVITVDGGRISAIEAVSGESAADLTLPWTAMPGLVDAHDHIGTDVGDERAQAAESVPENLLRGVRNLRQMIAGGVTTVRNCGERPGIEQYWQDGLRLGYLSGPRVVGARSLLCRTGGHCWYAACEVDGPDAIRAAVRANKRDGAEFIKVMATGGLATEGSNPLAAEYTRSELAALVDEAHRLGLPVAAHAYGGPGADDAIDVGVDSIEHGSLLERNQLERMRDRGAALVLTSTIVTAFINDPQVPEVIRQKMSPYSQSAVNTAKRAREIGVTVTVGTDGMHGNLVAEVEMLVSAGYSPAEALGAATRAAADVVGLTEAGELRPGGLADILFVTADPTRDLGVLRSPAAVMVGGSWMWPDSSPPSPR
jgi:imidazolonepropionase-like amidohydrolase